MWSTIWKGRQHGTISNRPPLPKTVTRCAPFATLALRTPRSYRADTRRAGTGVVFQNVTRNRILEFGPFRVGTPLYSTLPLMASQGAGVSRFFFLNLTKATPKFYGTKTSSYKAIAAPILRHFSLANNKALTFLFFFPPTSTILNIQNYLQLLGPLICSYTIRLAFLFTNHHWLLLATFSTNLLLICTHLHQHSPSYWICS